MKMNNGFILNIATAGAFSVISGMLLIFVSIILLGIYERFLDIAEFPKNDKKLFDNDIYEMLIDNYIENKKLFDKVGSILGNVSLFLLLAGTFIIIFCGFLIGILQGEWYPILLVTVGLYFLIKRLREDGLSYTIRKIRDSILRL